MKVHNAPITFGNNSKIRKEAINEAKAVSADIMESYKLGFKIANRDADCICTASVSKKPEGIIERFQSLRGKLFPKVQMSASVPASDAELYPEKLVEALAKKAKQAVDIISGKKVEIND